MAKVLRKCGFSGFNGQSWYTYLLFGCLWVHVNKHFRLPLVSFVRLPFLQYITTNILKYEKE